MDGEMTDKEVKEFRNLEPGKIFKSGNVILIVEEVDAYDCEGCIFQYNISDCKFFQKKGIIPECSFDEREDRKNIIFKEVE